MQTTATSLIPLFDQGALWQGRRARHAPSGLKTGHALLDHQLDNAGWQPGNLVELLYDGEGSGELRLLYPLLAQLSRQPRWIIWVDPPHLPYAPALAAAGIDTGRLLLVHSRNDRERHWTLEQALRSRECSAVLGWPGDHADDRVLRRLQLAAGQGSGLGFLFRGRRCRRQSSPAPYRGLLAPSGDGIDLTLFKRRQGWPLPCLHLPLSHDGHQAPPAESH